MPYQYRKSHVLVQNLEVDTWKKSLSTGHKKFNTNSSQPDQ